MAKKNILIQIDSDPLPSVFDRVVAVDAGAEHVFAYGGVTLEQVEALVHGAIFTRGPEDLKHTAIFIGGADVGLGERMLAKVQATFLGPLRTSVMMDANGANTTAAAAVLAAGAHLELDKTRALVLGGTGPVGQRVARLLARQGAQVRVGSRSRERAAEVAQGIAGLTGATVTGHAVSEEAKLAEALEGVELVVSAGAAGVRLLPQALWESAPSLRVAIDLNAVPPLGIEGVEMIDKGRPHRGVTCYGAIGVGGRKMKIHKAAVQALFAANDRVLDAEAIYELGRGL